MIFRHLLVYPNGLPLTLNHSRPRLDVNILRTSKLIHREASDVLYGEYLFGYSIMYSYCFMSQYPQFIESIQNIHINVSMCTRKLEIKKFKDCVRYFRGTLAADFLIKGSLTRLLNWLKRVLDRFTRLKAIEFDIYDDHHLDDGILHGRDTLKSALQPVLGKAESCHDGRGLRFHPIDYCNLTNLVRKLDDGDWADDLDGIRQE